MNILKTAERNMTGAGRVIPGEAAELAVFSTVHFLVDFCCIFLLTAFLLPLMADRFEWICCLVAYNLFSFAFQLPAGTFSDLYGRPKMIASSGCALIALAYGLFWLLFLSGLQGSPGDPVSFSGISPVPAETTRTRVLLFGTAVTAGIGNAFFHVGGGIDTLKKCGGRASRPGIFVSTGAFGVWLAPVLASRHAGTIIGTAAGILMMLASSLLLLALDRSERQLTKNIPVSSSEICGIVREQDDPDCQIGLRESRRAYHNGRLMTIAVFAVGCLFLTVVIRSYAGGLMNYSWKAVPLLAFLFTAGVSGGKLAGGLLGDRVGWMKSAAGSLILALLLFVAAPHHPSCGIFAVFLFNMTMPVTLTAISCLTGPGHEGTAFGLTTFALFLGTLPSSVNVLTETDLSPSWMLYVCVVLSVLLICAGLTGARLYDRKRNDEELPGS